MKRPLIVAEFIPRMVAGLLLAMIGASPAFAEKEAVPPEPAMVSESEASKQWKELQAQEQWVARLKKQIAGETKQLSDMRAALAAAFKLDPKKLESGDYSYNAKTDQFVEKKSVIASPEGAKQSVA